MNITKAHITKAVAVITMSLSVAGSAQAAETKCANTDLVPTAANVSQVRQATLCLINERRKSSNLPKLRSNGTLTRLAQSYASQMGREHFFSHTAPDGSTETTRVKQTSYFKGASSWRVGENIAQAPTGNDTPAMIMQIWMNSAGHRANILNRRLRDVGLGHILVTPSGDAGSTPRRSFGGR